MRRLAPILIALCALVALFGGSAATAAPGSEEAVTAKKKRSGCSKLGSRSARRRCARRTRCLRRSARLRTSRKRRRARAKCRRRVRAEKRRAAPERRAAPAPRSGPRRPATPGSDKPGVPLGRYVSVAAREFSLTLSRPALAAGSVTIELRNAGEDPHNLVVSPDNGSHSVIASFEEAGPGSVEAKGLALAAGRYRLWCSLEGHESLGMSARLRVE